MESRVRRATGIQAHRSRNGGLRRVQLRRRLLTTTADITDGRSPRGRLGMRWAGAAAAATTLAPCCLLCV